MVNTFSKSCIGVSLWPPKFNPIITLFTAFFNKDRLEVSKGSNHSDLSLLNPLAFLLLFKIFRPYEPKTTLDFHKNPSSYLYLVT